MHSAEEGSTTLDPRSRRPIILLPIYLSVFVTALGIGLVSPLIPLLVSQTGSGKLMVGLTASIMFASFVTTAWPLGLAIDRWGIKPFLLAGLVVYAISMAFMPWTTKLGYFFLLRALEGVGWAGVWVATETYVSWVSPDNRRGRNMGLYSMALALGTASGPLLGLKLYAIQAWLPFVATVLLTLVAFILVMLLIVEPEHTHEAHAYHPPIDAGMSEQGLFVPHRREKQAFSLIPKLITPLAIAAVYGYGVASLVALLPISRESEHEVGLLMTTTIVASVLAQLPIGHLTDRYGRRPVLIASLSLLILAAVVISFGPRFEILLILAVMVGALAGTLYPVGLSLLGDSISPRQLGTANGLFSLSYGLGSIIGPTSTGWAMGYFGPHALFGSIGALGTGLLLLVVLRLDRVLLLLRARLES